VVPSTEATNDCSRLTGSPGGKTAKRWNREEGKKYQKKEVECKEIRTELPGAPSCQKVNPDNLWTSRLPKGKGQGKRRVKKQEPKKRGEVPKALLLNSLSKKPLQAHQKLRQLRKEMGMEKKAFNGAKKGASCKQKGHRPAHPQKGCANSEVSAPQLREASNLKRALRREAKRPRPRAS